MEEQAKYAFEVMLSFGVTIVLLAGIVLLSVMRERRVRRELEDAEARHRGG